MPAAHHAVVAVAAGAGAVAGGDATVFEKWRAAKVAQWQSGGSQHLRSKFRTLPELEAWLQQKGAEAHAKTQEQRRKAAAKAAAAGAGGSRKCGASSARGGGGGGAGGGPPVLLIIVVATIAIIFLVAGLATMASSHAGGGSHAGAAEAFVRKGEPSIPAEELRHKAGTGADVLAAKLAAEGLLDKQKAAGQGGGLKVSDEDAHRAIADAERLAASGAEAARGGAKLSVFRPRLPPDAVARDDDLQFAPLPDQ